MQYCSTRQTRLHGLTASSSSNFNRVHDERAACPDPGRAADSARRPRHPRRQRGRRHRHAQALWVAQSPFKIFMVPKRSLVPLTYHGTRRSIHLFPFPNSSAIFGQCSAPSHHRPRCPRRLPPRRPCLHGNDDPLITQQESPEPQQLVGLCTHLADSLDDLKEAGVKGGHAKKLLARCSLSGVLMFSPLYASHHAATSP